MANQWWIDHTIFPGKDEKYKRLHLAQVYLSVG